MTLTSVTHTHHIHKHAHTGTHISHTHAYTQSHAQEGACTHTYTHHIHRHAHTYHTHMHRHTISLACREGIKTSLERNQERHWIGLKIIMEEMFDNVLWGRKEL